MLQGAREADKREGGDNGKGGRGLWGVDSNCRGVLKSIEDNTIAGKGRNLREGVSGFLLRCFWQKGSFLMEEGRKRQRRKDARVVRDLLLVAQVDVVWGRMNPREETPLRKEQGRRETNTEQETDKLGMGDNGIHQMGEWDTSIN